jgi:hypothetical protein
MGIGLQDICVTFWQRTCLHFIHAVKLCERMSLKMADYFSGRNFQAVHHSGCHMDITAILNHLCSEN